MSAVEYAVRCLTRGYSEPFIVPVGDPGHLREVIKEMRDAGEQAVPVSRKVDDWELAADLHVKISREISREEVTAIGDQVWEHETDPRTLADALLELRGYAPDLSDHLRADRLLRLVEELDHRSKVADVEPGPDETRDKLTEDADERVRTAADALIGGA